MYCFLVSHGECHILFDVGVRADWENLSPVVVPMIRNYTEVTRGKNVADILDADTTTGFSSKGLAAVIWSHAHFDHVGNTSLFPPSTPLVVGPGVKEECWPGYPTNPKSPMLDTDMLGRHVREIDFAGVHHTKIGRFDAVDYFRDGSFYLLDAPGHAPGHMCALARVTADPPTFVFLGADACHFAGHLRPSSYLPLPETISPSPLPRFLHCPGELLQQAHPDHKADEPFVKLTQMTHKDQDNANDTLAKIMELDAADNVLVLLAHDDGLEGEVPFFPERLNDWHASGAKKALRWAFCKHLEGAVGAVDGRANGKAMNGSAA